MSSFFHLSLNEKDLLRSILKSIGTCFEEKKKKKYRNLNETFKSLAIVLKKKESKFKEQTYNLTKSKYNIYIYIYMHCNKKSLTFG